MPQGNIQQVEAYILGRNGVPVDFHSCDGGLVDLTNGMTDDQGFYIVLAPGATEGLISVKPYQSDTFKSFPFFIGRNPMLIKAVNTAALGSHVATLAYWEK
jgi:hypothetical protein